MQKRYIHLFVLAAMLLLFSACAVQQTTMQDVYPKMYQSPPASILILPPVNKSTAADAKEYFACSLSEAVGLKGYYVLPVEATFGVLRDEGLYDAENITPTVLGNMKKHFGADAVLYSSIEKWDKSWALVSGSLNITAYFALISTANADTLWDYTVHTRVKLESSSDNFLAAMLESAVKTAMEDYFPNCLKANVLTMDEALPYGKHHPQFSLDATEPRSPVKSGEIEITK